MHAENFPIKWGDGSSDFAFEDVWEKRKVWVVEGTLKGHYLVDGKPMDRILVACFNKRYFPAP